MATIIPNAGAAGMALGDTLASAYSNALREGLNLATQANMQRNKDLMSWLKDYYDVKLGIKAAASDQSREQRQGVDTLVESLKGITNTPAGTGALTPISDPKNQNTNVGTYDPNANDGLRPLDLPPTLPTSAPPTTTKAKRSTPPSR